MSGTRGLLLPVEEARARLLALTQTLPAEVVPLRKAKGRVLAAAVRAPRDQPPFASSAMDGYALAAEDAFAGNRLQIKGEAAAGHAWQGQIKAGEACRIFTGAPLPKGANRVVIQEDVVVQGNEITLKDTIDPAAYVRPAGGDFEKGFLFHPKRPLSPADITLLSAMGHAEIKVRRKPEVAILSTGDELVAPDEVPRADQIIASNAYGIAAMLEQAGALCRILPIARDNKDSLRKSFEMALSSDLLLTIGGASVGDHDLVGPVLEEMGANRSFYKIAMRPGKPLMAGKLDQLLIIGLPGNPVSSLVCTRVFVLDVLRAMQSLAPASDRHMAPLAHDLPENGPREHFMRAVRLENGSMQIQARQDSSLMSVLAQSTHLAVIPAKSPALKAGTFIECLPLFN